MTALAATNTAHQHVTASVTQNSNTIIRLTHNLGIRVHNSKMTVWFKHKNMQQYHPNNAAMQQGPFLQVTQ